MFRLRRALGPLTAVWLACQAATLTIASVAIWTSADVAELECTCAGNHGICPMHHKSKAGLKECLMQSAGDSQAGVLTSLLGQVGLVQAVVHALIPVPIVASIPIDTTAGMLRPAPPDPPPPRA